MNEIHNAPRGVNQIFYNGGWHEVIQIPPDATPAQTRKSNSKRVHGNVLRGANRILMLPDDQRRIAVRKKLTKQRERELKLLTGVERMCETVRQKHQEFLFITDQQIQDELKRIAQVIHE